MELYFSQFYITRHIFLSKLKENKTENNIQSILFIIGSVAGIHWTNFSV